MKKVIGLCLFCLIGFAPEASAQYAGGEGDGYHSVTRAMSFPANLYRGGDGDGYDSATSEPSGATTR